MNRFYRSFDSIAQFFVQLINSVILPHTARSILTQCLGEAAEKTALEFDSFVSGIQEPLKANLKSASQITEFAKSTAVTLLNHQGLEVLYHQLVENTDIVCLADAVLKFLPLHLSDAESRQLSYRNCKNLKDHYGCGANCLLDRLADFASEKLKPVRSLNALDIIEVSGRGTANQYLKETVEKLSPVFLSFPPGLIPIAQQGKKMNSVLMVRSDKTINSKLSSVYSFLFGPETHFVDTENPYVIDLSSMTFGFPAFLIHGLSECRELALAREGTDKERNDTPDLWPMS